MFFMILSLHFSNDWKDKSIINLYRYKKKESSLNSEREYSEKVKQNRCNEYREERANELK